MRDQSSVPERRVVPLNGAPERRGGRYVLYWMQIAQRAEWSPALDHAIERANALGLPVLVYHGLRADYPHASDRLHAFVLEGARELPARFAARGIRYVFHLDRGERPRRKILLDLLPAAALVVTDFSPAFVVPAHNGALARHARVAAAAVDGNGVVPLREMTKAEWAARTIRPKIHRLLPAHFRAPERVEPKRDSLSLRLPGDAFVDPARLDVAETLASLPIDHSVPPSIEFRGGRAAAVARLDRFLARRLAGYADGRNEPGETWTSELSPYLHFGQISILEVALAARKAAATARAGRANADAFLEEAIVRRELAFNMALFEPNHATLEALPEWAAATLRAHRRDPRPWTYSARDFESAATHDAIWNAAQRELLLTGKIHGYVRMYWGKKIIEWSPTIEDAHRTMVHLNDRHGLDGRDPNGHANMLWCFGKHDRPWGERPVFGTVRTMTADGLRRKCDIEAYVRRVEALRG